MRARALGSLLSGILLFGGVLGACAGAEDPAVNVVPAAAGSTAAGSGNSAGAGSAAGANQAAGAPSVAGQGGVTSGGAPGFAGAAGSLALAGSGPVAAGGTSGGAGMPGAAGTTGSAGAGGVPGIPAVKLVVYLDDYSGSFTMWASKIDFTKMTHLNLAFMQASPQNQWSSVSGQSDASIKAVVDKAHAAGVKVLASLGGGGTDTSVANQYKNPANDDALVANLDAFLKRLNLDGADIDIEKESKAEVGDNYGTFVSKVVATLHPEGKLVTAAVAQYLQPYMNDDTLKLFDFVNIMIYSSSTNDYTNALNFYTGKGVPKTKLTLGIISETGQHTSVAAAKSITTMSKAYGGAMLWDIAGDTTGASSVYKAMQDSL